MIKVKKLVSGGIYVFRGLVNANSLEFEQEKDIKTFFKLAERYLSNYVQIIDYALTPHGWEMIVRIKDKRTLDKYIKKDSKSKYVSEWTVSRIIGERIRHFRSNFRRKLNKEQKRKGNGVRCSYEKFIFKDMGTAKERIERLRKGEIDLEQPEERFRGNMNYYDRDKKIRKQKKQGISLITSKFLREKGVGVVQSLHGIRLKVLNLLTITNDVLQVKLKFTSKAHNLVFHENL